MLFWRDFISSTLAVQTLFQLLSCTIEVTPSGGQSYISYCLNIAVLFKGSAPHVLHVASVFNKH